MTTAEILAKIPELAVLVVGDICLDRWCAYGPATAEPSRETGIPRIGVVSTEVTLGAGGTIANNLVALGAGRVAVMGAVGDDGSGYELTRALCARGIDFGMLVRAPGLQTFTYTKLINGDNGVEDLPRLDFINTQPLSRKAESELLARLCAAVPGFDVVIVSDQAETSAGGVVTPAMRRALEKLADAHPEKVFWGDSRARPELFRKVIVKPNQQEAEAACARLFGHTDYRRLFDHIQAKRLLVTHGPKGVLLVNDSRETWVTTQPVANPVDICGAGDSFSAGAAAALAVGAPAETAARFGNQVASVTIMKRGTGTASPEELLQAKLWHSWNSTRAS